MLDKTLFTDTDSVGTKCPRTPIYEDAPGAPVKIGQTVLVTGVDDECGNPNCIGHQGIVEYLHYGGGTGQIYPTVPLIGVRFSKLNDRLDSFFPSELVVLDPSKIHIFHAFPHDFGGTENTFSRDFAVTKAAFDRYLIEEGGASLWIEVFDNEEAVENDEHTEDCLSSTGS